jgi:hypothetical protein
VRSPFDPAWFPVSAVTALAFLVGYALAGFALPGPPPPDEVPIPIASPEVAPAAAAPAGGTPPRQVPSPAAAPPPAPTLVPVTTPPTPVYRPRGAQATAPDAPLPLPVARPSARPELEPDPQEEAEGIVITATALDEPDMTGMDPGDDAYDEVVEAQQRFHDLEVDIVSQGELTPEVWASLQEKHAAATQQLLDRAAQLNLSGHPLEAESLLVEWESLEARYAKRVRPPD